MTSLLKIDLLIFDFDGTLADSIPPAVAAIQAMVADLGLPYKSKEEINHYIGYGEIPLVSGAIGSKEPTLLAKARDLYFKHYTEKGIKTIPLYPHVKECLEYFKNKPKLILSNKRDEFIKMILDNHKLTRYFEDILGGDSAPCLKPDPCAISGVLKKFNATPNRALFIGDMTVDVETGKNAGTRTCAVTYGFDPRRKLEKSRPDFLIDDLLELKALIK